MTSEETIVQRIKKLLALAGSPNEHEAARAAEKAQELMLQYGVELGRIAAAKDKPVGAGSETIKGDVSPWRRELAHAVARSLGGRMIWDNDKPRSWTGWIEFWGERDTVAGIAALYEYLEAQLVVISAIEAAKVPHATAAKSMSWRRGFLSGATDRVSARLQERRRAILRAQGPEIGVYSNNQALAVVKNAVDRAFEDAHPPHSTRADSTSRKVDAAAHAAGERAGGRVDIGGTRVGSGRGQLASGGR